ncbi:MAG: crotonase/enoyl-CoA hydratase family protein [Minicystis sp.]
MNDSLVSYSLEGSTAIVRMDDGKANALSAAMIEALLGALDRAEKEAKALVLTGRPDRFCAGFDLRSMMAGAEAATALLRQGSDLLMRFYGTPLPLIIASTGHALAGGALLLLTGDLRFAGDGPFKIGLNEVSIGLPVPILAMELARDRLVAAELGKATLMSKIYAPEEAELAGYLDRVVAREDLLAHATKEAARLGALPRPAYSATKERLRGATIHKVRSTLEEDLARLLPPSK